MLPKTVGRKLVALFSDIFVIFQFCLSNSANIEASCGNAILG